MAAISSRPIRAHHSSHVHASFLYGIELCCIRRKKLVQEKSCTRNHVRRSSFLYKSTCTSFLTVCRHHYDFCSSEHVNIFIVNMTNADKDGAISCVRVDTIFRNESKYLDTDSAPSIYNDGTVNTFYTTAAIVNKQCMCK